MAFLTPRFDPFVVAVSILIAGLASYVALDLVKRIRALRSRSAELARSLNTANAELQSIDAQLKKQAFVDPLTGLPNRVLFEDRLLHAVRRSERAEERISERNQQRLAVLFVDLDGFKPVNDSFGHAAGDAVLKEAALRLRSAARDTDTVARVGGDEFVLLMEDVGNVTDCVTLAGRLVDALAQPFAIAERQVEISGSIGIVVYPDQGHRDKLVANATGLAFNSLAAIEQGSNGRTNPMVNAGAIATTSLTPGSTAEDKWKFIHDGLSRFAGRTL